MESVGRFSGLTREWAPYTRNLMKRHHFSAGRRLGVATMLGSVTLAVAAVPFDSAKITRVENKVTVGEIKAGQAAARRPAVVSEAVKANNFVQTGSESRAELQFKDSSLVRVGQNSVFSFEARSRTLSLQKGDMLFYVAPGQGAGTIKTPALTAAITGTLCKVAPDMIAVLRGSITIPIDLKPVRVPAGYAVRVINGKAQIFQFDPKEATRGKLYSMGPLPEDPGIQIEQDTPGLNFPDSHLQNAIDSGQVNPYVRRPTPPPQYRPISTPPPRRPPTPDPEERRR